MCGHDETEHEKTIKLGSAAMHPGVYCLRTTLVELDNATLWRTYIMLTNLESVFRSLKTDLGLRPVFHQVERRVEGHLHTILGLSPNPGGTHRVIV